MLFRKKIYTLLVKGVKAITLDGLVGTKLTILTMNGNLLNSEILGTNLSISEEPLTAEFFTEHGCLVILERNEHIGMYYGKPIDSESDNNEQREAGESIYSVKIAGIEIVNDGLEKLITEKDLIIQ